MGWIKFSVLQYCCRLLKKKHVKKRWRKKKEKKRKSRSKDNKASSPLHPNTKQGTFHYHIQPARSTEMPVFNLSISNISEQPQRQGGKNGYDPGQQSLGVESLGCVGEEQLTQRREATVTLTQHVENLLQVPFCSRAVHVLGQHSVLLGPAHSQTSSLPSLSAAHTIRWYRPRAP